MKFLAILLFAGASQAFLVRREAEADAEAEPGYGYSHGAVSAPVCNSVPVITCNPRQVETPRQECHQEYDEIVDTTITEHCEEVITTTCQQTSTRSIITRRVVGRDTKVVATGVVNRAPHHQVDPPPPSPPHHHHLFRRGVEDQVAPSEDLLLPELGPAEVHETPAQISQPVCHTVPVKVRQVHN